MARHWWLSDKTIYRADHEDFQNDPAGYKVYRMERELKGWNNISTTSESDMQEMAKRACMKFEVKKFPDIKIVTKKRTDIIGHSSSEGIELNSYRGGDSPLILMHELAHWITDDIYGDTTDDHGEEWAWTYIELVDYFRLIPRWLFTQLFDKYGIAY